MTLASDRPATVATSLAAGVHVDIQCRGCGRWQRLDLAALAAHGHADTPLLALPLRCSVCGAREHDGVVSPDYPAMLPPPGTAS